MAASWTADRFPQFERAMRRLIEQHRELEDEPLRLAIAYLPANRDPRHIFLLEVIHAFGESLNPERDLFEVTFVRVSHFSRAQSAWRRGRTYPARFIGVCANRVDSS